ncbi:hypothetical protein [Marinitenerispora sediminis]|uniref:Uncharacterized protein n=1 Tax=Marinitenerispora sediminis TaxID=1931232 RepID=A0A368T3Y9_9ACTN|nr:hypothetical protein [Marinitenerispora sediminis]RCV49755.1 hypothetical protein DEF28_20005 [Marinitenerispora sediminis]RCV53569.1 hypothetical protein DEF23_17355 [Marinitenerispora sediminis]RCV57667.1 hypothetical protein DEF24_14915 [Marinitenerispora sediminis]
MATALHRPDVRQRLVETAQGETWALRMECPHPDCEPGPAHAGVSRQAMARAEADVEAHRQEVAPPEGERCRDPRRHRTRQWWDHCTLCADQLALPGMEPDALTAEAAA